MTSPTLPDNSVAAAAYLRILFASTVEARQAVDRIESLSEQDRILFLIAVAERAPGSVSDALNTLPCLHGCSHRRHDGERCLAALLDDAGLDALCPCGPPLVSVPAHEETAEEARRHEDCIDASRDAL